jgi:hypothetical protein
MMRVEVGIRLNRWRAEDAQVRIYFCIGHLAMELMTGELFMKKAWLSRTASGE